MAMCGRGIGLSLLIGLGACGAKTTLDESGDSPWPSAQTQDRGGKPKPGSSPKPNASPGPGVRFDQGDPLGACQEGFLEADEPDRPCNCLVEGVCFDSKPEACACICPRDSSHNTCVSAWDCTEGSRTKVSCYAI